MKKLNLTLSALLAISLALAGCGNDENETPQVAIRVSSEIEVAESARNAATRAAKSAWEADDAIGIFMLNGDAVDTYSNVAYTTADNGVFNPQATTIYLPADGSGRKFAAYYPYQAAMAGSTYAIDLGDQSKQSDIDFMMSEKENGTNSLVTDVTRDNPDVKFRFHHILAKVSLTIKTGNGFAGDNSELAGLKVKLTGQKTKGSCDVLNDNAATATGNADQTIWLLTAADGLTAEAIVMPADSYAGMKFQLETQNSGSYEWALSQSTEATTFEQGKEYKYTITISKTGLSVAATIADWEPGNGNGDAGEAN